AELVIIDERSDSGAIAAHGAARIAADFKFLEAHLQSIVEEQTADEGRTRAKNKLDGFSRLDAADEARKDAKDAPLRAARHFPRRWRLGIKAAVARTARRRENGSLAVKTEDAAVDIGLFQQHTDI